MVESPRPPVAGVRRSRPATNETARGSCAPPGHGFEPPSMRFSSALKVMFFSTPLVSGNTRVQCNTIPAVEFSSRVGFPARRRCRICRTAASICSSMICSPSVGRHLVQQRRLKETAGSTCRACRHASRRPPRARPARRATRLPAPGSSRSGGARGPASPPTLRLSRSATAACEAWLPPLSPISAMSTKPCCPELRAAYSRTCSNTSAAS